MKKYLFILLIIVVHFSCRKENELEGVALGVNPFETPSLPIVGVDRAERINSSILLLDLIVDHNRIPDHITYTHLAIIDPFGDTVLTKKERNIFVKHRDTLPSTYLIGLHEMSGNHFSHLNKFTYP